MADFKKHLAVANKNRKTDGTTNNLTSSRGHMIVRFEIEGRNTGTGETTSGNLGNFNILKLTSLSTIVF